jgi:hypothetical protein
MDQSSKKTLSSQTKVFTLRNESQETNSFPLALFRILFGLVLTRFFWDMLSGPWISATFENAQVVMKYDLLPWIEASPAQLRLILLVLMSSSIFFTLGLFYRANCFILLFLYSYLFLLDATWSTSSRYLILVLIVLFTLTNCHKSGSIDAIAFPWLGVASMNVPTLHLTAFKVVFTAASCYAGLAKWLSEDWMERAEPLATWLFFGSVSHSYPLWSFLSGPGYGFLPSALLDLSFILSYAVVSIEIVGSVSLWHRWSRPLGLIAVALLQLFHSSIAQGVYPYVVICSFCLWVDHSISKSVLQLVGLGDRKTQLQKAKNGSSSNPLNVVSRFASKISTTLIFLLLAQQIVYPILPYTGTHSPSWSLRANLGSWRMMLHSQDTLVSWYANKLPNPKSNVMNPGNSYLITHHSDSYSRNRVSEDSWHEILNSPSLLMRWSERMILGTVRQNAFNPALLHVNAYRSINGRPYQLWFSPSKSDVVHNSCSWSITGCDALIESQIEEFNSLEWMYRQQVFIDEWIQRGHEAVVFAQRKGASFDIAFEPFAETLYFILMSGKVSLDASDSADGLIQPMVGEQVEISWRAFHSIRTVGKEPAAWAYVWPWPRNMTLGDAMGM